MLLPSFLSLFLLVEPAPSSPSRSAAIEPASPTATAAVVVVVTSKLGPEDDGVVEGVVREAVTKGLADRGLSPADRGTARLSVEIDWSDDAHGGYVLRYATKAVGQPETQRTSPCSRCGSDGLIALIDDDLDALRPELQAAATAPRPKPELGSDSPPARPMATAPTRRHKLGPMGIAGATLTGTGLAVLVPGIVLSAVGDRTRVDPSDATRVDVWSLRTPGLVLVGVGAALTITGAALLGVDAKRRSARRAHVHPTVGAVNGLAVAVRW